MGKESYSSKVYKFLARNMAIDYNKVSEADFNEKMKSPDFAKSMYSVMKEAQRNGIVGTLKPYEEFVSEFGQTTPTTTTTDVVTEEETPQQGTPARTFPTPNELNPNRNYDSKLGGTMPIAERGAKSGKLQQVSTEWIPLPNTGGTRATSNQPQPVPEETQIAPIDQQAGQVQGGRPISGDVLANAPKQQFQWSGQAPTKPVVQPQTGMPQTPEQGMQQGGINPADLAVSTLGSAETSLISQIGSELKGIAETGYSLDKKIVSALEGTPFEGGYVAPYSKPEDSWIYQAGQGLQNFTEEYLYRNPEYAGGILDVIAQGTGSVGAIALTGGLNPAGGVMKLGTKAMTNPQLLAYGVSQLFKAPMIRGAFAMVGQETDSARQLHRMANQMDKDAYVVERMALGEDKADAGKAWETLRTKTEDEVAESMILPGIVAGVTEAIPLERLLVRLGKPAQNIIVNAFKQGGIQGAEEATQEVIQQTIINAGIGNTYNEAHRLTTGLLESAEGGGATGFVLGSVLTALVGKRANVKQRLQAGEISQKDAIAEMEDINKAEKLVQDKLQALDNVVNSKANEEIKALTESKEAQTFFETNEPSLTNPLVTMPKEVETVLDKIADGVLISPESLHEAYQWANGSVKATLENQALTPAEKGATLNIFNGMLSDIDNANTGSQVPKIVIKPEPKIGDKVNYSGIKGILSNDADGNVVVVDESGEQTLVEGGLSGRKMTALGVELMSASKTPKKEGSTPVDVSYSFDDNTVSVYGKNYKYDGVEVGKDGKTTGIRVIDEKGNTKTIRNSEVVQAVESQKLEAEQSTQTEPTVENTESVEPVTPIDTPSINQARKVRKKKQVKAETTTEPVVSPEVVAETTTEQVAPVAEPVQETVTPAETVATANPALADVESTAKALEGVDKETEDLSTALMVAEGSLKNNDLRKSKQRDKFIPIIKSLLKEGEYIGQSFKGQTSESASNSISQTISSAYHSAKAKPESERTAQETELITQVEQLLTPTQDAVQKQTAGQVPVQSGTTSSQEVAKGEPQAEPQSTADKGQTQETGKKEVGGETTAEVDTEQAPAKKTLSEEFGISADDVNNLVEQKRKTFEGYSVEMALQELGVPQDKIKDALPAYVAEMLEGNLPTKSPVKKQKIDEDLIPDGEIKIQPIPSKGKGKPAKTTEEKIDLVSDATDNKSDRDYAKVVHKNADNKEVVATDAHVMIVVKDDSITETESVDVKTGQKADVRYPDYKSVIPDTAKRKDKKKVNAKTIYNLASGIAKATKMFTGRIIPARIVIGDTEVFLNAEQLKRGLEPFVRSGITDIEVSIDGYNRAVVFKGGDITSLVMPIEYKGENAGYTTVISEEQSTPTTKQQATAQTKPTAEAVATTEETGGQEAGQVTPETQVATEVVITEPNATDVETITKIENATEKGRELALAKPVNKWVKRAFDTYEDISSRAKKAGIYDGKTLKIGGQEIELDTPAKFKAFLAQSQNNFDAINEAVKDIPSEQKTDTNPSPKTVEEKSKEVFNDAKSTFVFPIGLNPKFKFDSRLPENVVRFFKKYFRPRGLWTKGMFSAKRGMENQISAQVQKSEFLVRDLRNAVKEAYPKGVTQEQLQAMNDVLQGMPREIPANLYSPLTKMREHIDELSKMMISEGIIDERLVPVFNANMGIYTTRTYAIHNDPKSWLDYIENEPEGQQIRNNAVNFLRQATEAKADRLDKFADENEKRAEKLFRRSELAEGDEALMLQVKADEVIARADKQRELARTMREQDFDALVVAFLEKKGQPLDVVRKGNVGAKDLGILKKRKNILETDLALMGEEKDPLTNYTMSVAKMSALIANNQFLNEVKAQGVADGLFTKTPKGKNTAEIASASTDSMSPLNGLYTTKDIAEAFKEFDANTKSPWYIDAMLWFNAAVKVNKTVLSQGTHIRNFISNPIIELANGYIPTLKGKAIDSQMEQILNRRFGDKEKLRDYIIKLTELGVLGQGGNYRDILSVYEDLKGNKYDYQKLIEPKIRGAAKKSWNIAQKVYKGGDEFWKVVAFENERAVFEKAYGDTKTSEELDQMAADKIRRTRVDYSMVPKAVKAINKIPFTGTFVTFPAEVLRIGFNIPAVAYEEMNSGNKVLREHGIKRMAGYLTAMTLPYGVKEFAKYLLGMDDEEEEARKKFLAPWAQNSTLIWIGKDRYIDTGFSDAFSILKKPIVAFSRGKSAAEGALSATKEFLGPVISEEIGYKTLKNVSDNTDEFGNPIYDENADAGTIYTQVSTYVLKQVEPGTVSQARRLYLGETGALSEKGQQYRTSDEVLNAVFGIKPVTINWDNAVSYKFRDAVEGINNSNKFFLKKSKELRKDDKEGRRKAAESTNLAVENAYNDLREYYTSALKIGMIPQKVVDIMKQSGVPKELMYAVVNNTGYKNYIIVLNDGTVIDRNTQRLLRER